MKRYTLTTLLVVCVCTCMTVSAQHNPNIIIAPTESRSMGSIVTMSANSHYIMTASRTVEIWNINSGDRVSIFKDFDRPFYDSSGMRLIPGGISTTSFSPDGTLVVTGGTDFTAMIWDVSSGELLQSIRLDDNVEFGLGNVAAAAIAPDNQLVAASATSFDGILIFDIDTGELVQTIDSERATDKLQFIDNGNKLFYATGLYAKVYDLVDNQVIFQKSIGYAELSESGKNIIIHFGGSIENWSVTGELIASSETPDWTKPNLRPALSPDGKRVAVSSANQDQTIRLNNLSSKMNERLFSKDNFSNLVGHAFSPNGKIYYAYTKDQVFIYDISDLTSSVSDAKSMQ